MKFVTGILIILCGCSNPTTRTSIYDQKLKTIDGIEFDFSSLKKNKANVFVLLLSDCPSCINYSLTLNQIHKEFSPQGIPVTGIFPGEYGTQQEMKNYRNEFSISFPLLMDPQKKITSVLKATVAPEAVVINGNGEILYKGRIDDWMYAIGKKKIEVTRHDLIDALQAIAENRPVSVKETTPIGCIIE
ncbi:MAG: redoxin domain-containing protein [Bacteroidia bacterium]|nr:redoxin domain-containing protein [Bacteroidia bacterium]